MNLESLPTSFNLAETIAWIAFRDHTRPVHTDWNSSLWTAMHGLAPGSEEIRDAYHRWSLAERNLDSQIQGASRQFVDRIQSGELLVAGDLLTAGSPIGDVDSRRQDPIPADTLRLPCTVPWEYLGNRGGWLHFREGITFGLACYRRYCRIQVAAKDVMRLWPAVEADCAALIACMNKIAAEWMAEKGSKPKRDHVFGECVRRIKAEGKKVTFQAVENAYPDIDLEYRRRRGEKG